MNTRLRWVLLQIARRLWFRATAFSVLGVATALFAGVARRYIPADIPGKIGAEAVDALLSILATSMLSVTIFSLSTLVAAHASATNHATPRATRLLSQDHTAQNALSTFVGAFLFSLVGLIALQSGLYSNGGLVVIYVATLAVIVLIVVTLLRWIDHVLRLGRVGETADRVEETAARAMRDRHEYPFLGGYPYPAEDQMPSDTTPVYADRMGYVQHVDMSALHDLTRSGAVKVFVRSAPGAYVHPGRPLALLHGFMVEGDIDRARAAFNVGDTRSFDQDPRFGTAVLAEIASRALSPAVNDPGTAIDVLGRAARLMSIWTEPRERAGEGPKFPFVHVPETTVGELFDDLFTPIGRDGASMVEIGIRLQKTLQVLAGLGDRRYAVAALACSRLALERAEHALAIEADRQRVRSAAADVERIASAYIEPK
ncbi:DUF2254 domain-containing protein [Lysobacter korlensis]|uniref:DUF2254 domain-containing protein n=1 Tax=Lysobacter korlensis TaxID=553636 RepID=A0ABV6RN61_9GAMM